MKQRCALAIACALLGGCAKVPAHLQTAMQRQSMELVQIRSFYNDAINKLFDEIEKLQLHYINEFEQSMIDKYKFKRGGDPGTVDRSDTLNVILIPIQSRIHTFADGRRAKVHTDLAAMKLEYLKLNQSIDNAQALNQAVGEYVESLIRLQKAQDAFGQTLVSKVDAIQRVVLPGVNALGEVEKFLASTFSDQAPSAPATSPATN